MTSKVLTASKEIDVLRLSLTISKNFSYDTITSIEVS